MTLLRSFVMLNLVQHLFFLWRNDNLLITLVLVHEAFYQIPAAVQH
jgi:hypothetical protein